MMRRIRWVLRLYPRAWRARYGAEFEALLVQTGLGWQDFFNVAGGAMQIRVRSISFVWTAAVCGVLGAVAFVAIAALEPIRYVSRSVAAASVSDPREFSQDLSAVMNVALTRSALETVIRENNLYPDLRGKVAPPDLVNRMRRDIDVRVSGSPLEGRNAFMVAFSYRDPQNAQRVTTDLMAKLDAELSLGKDGQGQPVAVEVLDQPSSPERPINHAFGRVSILGLLGGGLLGLLLAGGLRFASTLSAPRASQ